MLPTADELRELFTYDPETGVLRNRCRRGAKGAPGEIAGTIHHTGYRIVTIAGRKIKASRLIWCMRTGSWPTTGIDHRDGDKSNDRAGNLRLATHAQNMANRKSLDGRLKGASFHRGHGRYNPRIRKEGRLVNLGYFDTPEEAHAAYTDAAPRIHGEFANTGLAGATGSSSPTPQEQGALE